jgi:hypothetical protein
MFVGVLNVVSFNASTLLFPSRVRLEPTFFFGEAKEKSSKKERRLFGNGSECQKDSSTLVAHCSSQLGGAGILRLSLATI